MKRMFLRWAGCTECKYGAINCVKYASCYRCPVCRKEDGACLCMEDATNKEKLTGRCMYFEKDNKERI